MLFKQIAGAALMTLLTATAAVSQTGDVKGWTPRAPGGAAAGSGGAKAPPPGGAATGPKSIVRGPGDPAPKAPGGIAGTPRPPAGIGGKAPPSAGGGGKKPGAGVAAAPEHGFILATDPESVQRAIQNAGYRAELTTDDDGNPKIIGSSSNSTYWVMFLDCQLEIGCAGLQFFVGYDKEYAPSLEAINDFNNQYRYIRASIGDNGNPLMYMDMIVRDGGISEGAFEQYVLLWNQFVPAFEELIGW